MGRAEQQPSSGVRIKQLDEDEEDSEEEDDEDDEDDEEEEEEEVKLPQKRAQKPEVCACPHRSSTDSASLIQRDACWRFISGTLARATR